MGYQFVYLVKYFDNIRALITNITYILGLRVLMGSDQCTINAFLK